jgi:prolyl-tRNA editing enzyme YbaK/EbsC (Cys-tRNA(Pro) deacylase)
MASTDVTRALEEAGAQHDLLAHAHTESALAEAEALGLDPADVGKTLVIATPEGNIRAVIPGGCRLDMAKVRDVVGAAGKNVHLASEDDLARDYPEFDLGAVPPFGGARRDRVIVDRRVTDRESVVVEAGSHEQSLRIGTDDLVRVTDAEVVDICED